MNKCFCGDAAKLHTRSRAGHAQRFWVSCETCQASTPVVLSQKGAIEMWNRMMRGEEDGWRGANCGQCAWRGKTWSPYCSVDTLTFCRRFSFGGDTEIGRISVTNPACPEFRRL